MRKYIGILLIAIFVLGFISGQFSALKKVKEEISIGTILDNVGYNFSRCEHCRHKCNWKESEVIFYEEHKGMFPLCRECFYNITVPYVLWYYLKHLEDYCENTDKQIERIATEIGIKKGSQI